MKRGTLPIIGGGITLAYLAAAVAFSAAHRSAFFHLSPDGWANFIAGIFAPLAFLWLVLGYFQQGEELHNSAEALRLQGEELRASVEQQRELVAVSREQFEHERARLENEANDRARQSRPLLRLSPAGSWHPPDAANRRYTFALLNAGAPCTDVFVYCEGKVVGRFPLIEKGQSHEFALNIPEFDAPEVWPIEVNYLDARAMPGSERFRLTIAAGNRIGQIDVEPWPITGNMNATLADAVAENRAKPTES